MEKEKITVIDENGQTREASVLLYFTLSEYNKNYVVYTFDETVKDDYTKVYAAIVKENSDENISFEKINNDDEWQKVKDFMKKAIRESREG